MKLIHPISCLLLFALSIPLFSHAETKPVPANGKLKIFIVSGQSNMVGFGQLKGDIPGTMEMLVKNKPDDYGHLVDKKGKPIVRDDVWIVNLSYADKVAQGCLTTGYGAD